MSQRITRRWYTGSGRTPPIRRILSMLPLWGRPFFAAGVAIGAAWSGHGGWGCGWGNNEVNINASTNNNFTKNNYNNPQKYQANTESAIGSITRNTARAPSTRIRHGSEVWAAGFGCRRQTKHLRRPRVRRWRRARGVVESLRPATSAVAGERERFGRIRQGRKRTCVQQSRPGEPAVLLPGALQCREVRPG